MPCVSLMTILLDSADNAHDIPCTEVTIVTWCTSDPTSTICYILTKKKDVCVQCKFQPELNTNQTELVNCLVQEAVPWLMLGEFFL